jgi:hypothetical protein
MRSLWRNITSQDGNAHRVFGPEALRHDLTTHCACRPRVKVIGSAGKLVLHQIITPVHVPHVRLERSH